MTTVAATAPACTKCAVHVEATFRVAGLDCAEEVRILERRLGPMPGIDRLNADVVGQKLHVAYDAAVLEPARIMDAVAETGMRAWLEHERPLDAGTADRSTWALWAGAAVLALGYTMPLVVPSSGSHLLRTAPFVVAIALTGVRPLTKAMQSVRRRSLDIHVLMMVAVAGAIALGEWAEAATVVSLFGLSQWLEARTMASAREAIGALITLAPVEARVKHGDHEHLTAVDAVVPGSIIAIRPGEKIPLDGVVVAGRSDVNQAPITGESLPIERTVNDDVYAGTINGHGALDVRVTRAVRDTTLARIVHLVETAQAQRAPAQQFIDRFARWYTPAVVLTAVAVAAVPLVTGGDVSAWVYRALVLLVVACPCALVISTPVSIVAALARAARHGVLVKGGVHLERLAQVKVVAFDKTGTLTTGRPVATGVPGGPPPDLEWLAAAAAVEQRSEHPVAHAVVTLARAHGVEPDVAEDVRALPGLGAEGRWRGHHVVVANTRLAEERGAMTSAARRDAEACDAAGVTPVFVAIDGVVGLTLAVSDEPRPAAHDVVQMLREHGVRHVAMLTGDADGPADAMARAVGVTDVRAGLLPADKVAAVGALRAAYGPVAMVGDGVNDAPALASADVGIVMGAIGSPAALEVADVALMSDELQKLPYALRLSRATLANVRTNVALSLGLKAAVLALAVAGLSTLWLAILADTGASVVVVANAMRLLRHR